MSSKKAQASKICLKEGNVLQFDDKKNANTFKNFYSNLASDLVAKLPIAKNIFGEKSVQEYYSTKNIPFNSFKFKNVKTEDMHK